MKSKFLGSKNFVIALLFAATVILLNGCSGGAMPEQQATTTTAPASAKKNAYAEEEKTSTATSTSASETASADFMSNKGIGPVKNLELPATIDDKLAAHGQEVYKAKCTSCHKPEKRFIGPAPKGILDRRSPEWVMNMILNPEQMVKEDPIAKQLLADYNYSPMANQNLTEDEARAVLEYFRTL